MTLFTWIPLAILCLLGAMSPGPSLAVVLWNTLQRGSAAGYSAALSHAAAVALYGLLTVAGLAVLVTGRVEIYDGLRIAGAAYLLYLGAKSLRGGTPTALDSQQQAVRGGRRNAIADGFLIAFLNPKLAVFMLALFSQFMTPETGWIHRGIMVATVGTIDALWYCVVVTLVSRESMLRRLRRAGTTIDRLFGVMLILLALGVLVSVLK